MCSLLCGFSELVREEGDISITSDLTDEKLGTWCTKVEMKLRYLRCLRRALVKEMNDRACRAVYGTLQENKGDKADVSRVVPVKGEKPPAGAVMILGDPEPEPTPEPVPAAYSQPTLTPKPEPEPKSVPDHGTHVFMEVMEEGRGAIRCKHCNVLTRTIAAQNACAKLPPFAYAEDADFQTLCKMEREDLEAEYREVTGYEPRPRMLNGQMADAILTRKNVKPEAPVASETPTEVAANPEEPVPGSLVCRDCKAVMPPERPEMFCSECNGTNLTKKRRPRKKKEGNGATTEAKPKRTRKKKDDAPPKHPAEQYRPSPPYGKGSKEQDKYCITDRLICNASDCGATPVLIRWPIDQGTSFNVSYVCLTCKQAGCYVKLDEETLAGIFSHGQHVSIFDDSLLSLIEQAKTPLLDGPGAEVVEVADMVVATNTDLCLSCGKLKTECVCQVKSTPTVDNTAQQLQSSMDNLGAPEPNRAEEVVDFVIEEVTPGVMPDIFREEVINQSLEWDNVRLIKEWEKATGKKYDAQDPPGIDVMRGEIAESLGACRPATV